MLGKKRSAKQIKEAENEESDKQSPIKINIEQVDTDKENEEMNHNTKYL